MRIFAHASGRAPYLCVVQVQFFCVIEVFQKMGLRVIVQIDPQETFGQSGVCLHLSLPSLLYSGVGRVIWYTINEDRAIR